jgi:hypothetical protein
MSVTSSNKTGGPRGSEEIPMSTEVDSAALRPLEESVVWIRTPASSPALHCTALLQGRAHSLMHKYEFETEGTSISGLLVICNIT